MTHRTDATVTVTSSAPTRRQVIAGGTLLAGVSAFARSAWGKYNPAGLQEKIPADVATRTSLHQEIAFNASPARIYAILLDSKQFAAVTGMAAEIDSKPGGAFKTFGGLIVGRNVELVPDTRIVQAWRPTHWDPGVYSIVRFELKARESGCTLVLDHTGFPAGEFDHLNEGWPLRYWEPLKKFLASQAG